MERPAVYGLEVILGVVSLVEDQRDVAGLVGQSPAAFGQLVHDAAEGHGVVLIARIGVVKERHLAVGGDQQRQPDDPQVVASLFTVAPLRELGTSVEAIDEAEEVGGVEQKAAKIQAEV